MHQSKLIISSENYYSCELTKKIPVRVTIMSTLGDVGVGYIESLNNNHDDIDNYIEGMRSMKEILFMEITHEMENRVWNRTQHKIDFPSISETIYESGSLIIFPILIEAGRQHHNIVSPDSNNVRKLFTLLKERYSKTEIKHLSSIPITDQSSLLSKKQHEALDLSVTLGYYEIPWRVKMEEIAQHLGIKRIAFQERLRRAENKIIKLFHQNSGRDLSRSHDRSIPML